jgi:peptide/nickel transport system permease protein
MMLAGRLSLAVGARGLGRGGALGTALGALAGWYGGALDRVSMALADTLLAVPRLILLLVIAALWGPGHGHGRRRARGHRLDGRRAARPRRGARGAHPAVRGRGRGPRRDRRRLLWRHVLPNAVGPAIVATTLGVGNAILLESGLSFLGLGIQPPAPSWGNMIAGGRDLIVTAPWVAVAPGLALVATVLACTLLGDDLRDRLAGEGPGSLGERA